MPWLVRDDDVVASVEEATSRRARRQGLLGRDGISGALILSPARAVHTIGMRFAIDVVFLDADLTVIDIVTMQPNRVGRPRWSARCVLEAEAGFARRHSVANGDVFRIEPADDEPDGEASIDG